MWEWAGWRKRGGEGGLREVPGPTSPHIALCVGEKFAVAGPVGTSKNVHLRRGSGLLISLPFRRPLAGALGETTRAAAAVVQHARPFLRHATLGELLSCCAQRFRALAADPGTWLEPARPAKVESWLLCTQDLDSHTYNFSHRAPHTGWCAFQLPISAKLDLSFPGCSHSVL